ncbi:hypothetical protein L1785_19805 [Antribacter sp. KLBMP9083]|uniref:Uncharacterized protein n=1 Tax=Antribacter soli TaxID=2910976 RepID=A0AA41QJE7_9MICO|nr:hypothetical protein [Antribacter soli]MCF4123219.1 hypothetical protein [Antribacter soli]
MTSIYGLNLPLGPGQDDLPRLFEHLAGSLRASGSAIEAGSMMLSFECIEQTQDGPLPSFRFSVSAEDDPDPVEDPAAGQAEAPEEAQSGRTGQFVMPRPHPLPEGLRDGAPARVFHVELPSDAAGNDVPALLETGAQLLREHGLGCDRVVAVSLQDGLWDDAREDFAFSLLIVALDEPRPFVPARIIRKRRSLGPLQGLGAPGRDRLRRHRR